jgi:hypothetical protein
VIVPRDPHRPITDDQRVRLVRRYPSVERLRVVFALAPGIAIAEALSRGEPLNPALVDQHELEKARHGELVQLVRRFDLVPLQADAGEAA